MRDQLMVAYGRHPTDTAHSPMPWQKPFLLHSIHQKKLGNADDMVSGDSRSQRSSCALFSCMDQDNKVSPSFVYWSTELSILDPHISEMRCKDTSWSLRGLADCPGAASYTSHGATPGPTREPQSSLSLLRTQKLKLPPSGTVMPRESWPKSTMLNKAQN